MEQKIILLDEPTAGLDPISTKLILDIINNLRKSNVKVIISSHDMNLILSLIHI